MAVAGHPFKFVTNRYYQQESQDIATQLLAQYLMPPPDGHVLILGSPSGALALVAAKLAPGIPVMLADHHVAALSYAKMNIEFNGVSPSARLDVIPTSSLADKQADWVGAAYANIHYIEGHAMFLSVAAQVFRLLRPGGTLSIAGANNRGVVGLSGKVEKLFGNMTVVAYKKGHRVVSFVKQTASPLTDYPVVRKSHVYRLQGKEIRITGDPRVFARGELDEGTRLLAESFEIGGEDAAADVGCGSGIIGILAALLSPRGYVVLTDSNVYAVELAMENVKLNSLTNATVLPSDLLLAVRDMRFDAVLSNPPFHSGHRKTLEISDQLVRQSYGVLKEEGRLFLVANVFLPYERAIRDIFGDVEQVVATRRYKVLTARRR